MCVSLLKNPCFYKKKKKLDEWELGRIEIQKLFGVGGLLYYLKTNSASAALAWICLIFPSFSNEIGSFFRIFEDSERKGMKEMNDSFLPT